MQMIEERRIHIMPKTHINTKNTKMNTKWLNNALRSIGVTSKASLKSMAPNISDAVSTGAKTSKNLITNIKSSKNGIDGVMNTLRTNRYVSIAEKAYNNAPVITAILLFCFL